MLDLNLGQKKKKDKKWTKVLNSLIASIRPGLLPSQGYNRSNPEVHFTALTSIVLEVLGLTSQWQVPYLENGANGSIYLIRFSWELNDLIYVNI